MLEIRLNCKKYNKDLSNTSTEAVIRFIEYVWYKHIR